VIETSEQAALNFDDTTPVNIVTGGTAGAGLTKSLWQTDCIGVRMTLTVSWGPRCDGAVAWTSSVVW